MILQLSKHKLIVFSLHSLLLHFYLIFFNWFKNRNISCTWPDHYMCIRCLNHLIYPYTNHQCCYRQYIQKCSRKLTHYTDQHCKIYMFAHNCYIKESFNQLLDKQRINDQAQYQQMQGERSKLWYQVMEAQIELLIVKWSKFR